MGKTVDTCIDKIHSISVIEDVGIYFQPILVALIDCRTIEIWRKPGRPSISIIDPDLDEVDFVRGKLLYRFSRLVFRCDFVGDAGVCRPAGSGIRRTDT